MKFETNIELARHLRDVHGHNPSILFTQEEIREIFQLWCSGKNTGFIARRLKANIGDIRKAINYMITNSNNEKFLKSLV